MAKHCDGRDFDFLIGKSIIKVEKKIVDDGYGYVLTCQDGSIIEIAQNEGCGGCSNAWSYFEDLEKLQNNHNIITNVECEYGKTEWDCDEFKLFIFYQDDKLTISGTDGYGNGYYGGGFYVTIKDVKEVK